MSWSWADRIFDPVIEARHAQIDCFLAKDLALQLLLAHAFHLTDQPLDLGSDVLFEILLGENGGLGIGDGIDSDEVIVTPTGMDFFCAAFAM
jgi:hypothetical protein